jgi:hypothetical protein
MGFDLRYNFINTFRTVDAWRNNILLNAQGGLLPGFKQRKTHLGMQQSSFEIDPGSAGNSQIGGRAPMNLTAGELTIQRTALQHRQDPLKSAEGNLANLGIQGNGFFAVAESLNPGARVMLTRDGSFTWKQTGVDKTTNNPVYQLVNGQGLFVLRAGDIETNPGSPNFMKVRRLPPSGAVDGNGNPLPPEETGPPGMLGSRDGILDGSNDPRGNPLKGIPTYVTGNNGQETLTPPADGNVSQLAIMRVPNQADLNISSFGPTTYNLSLSTLAGSTVRTAAQFYQEVGNTTFDPNKGAFPVVGNRIEQVDAQVALQLSILENQTADFVFKNLSTMLQEYNNAQDQLLNLIR